MHRLRLMAANARAAEKRSGQADRSRFRSGPMRVKGRGTPEGGAPELSEAVLLLREITRTFRETACPHDGDVEAFAADGPFRPHGVPASELAPGSARCPECGAFRVDDDCPVDVRLTVAILRRAVRLLDKIDEDEGEF